ncbi:CCA tRNA nucleotidyltransferase [Zhengella sp. ZM62]|uniref:CCA tRNA nucleotidyltransferase n=1 Tax=Zhengella sedimenti TaxID=3390035 RepID=UPI003975604F
MSGTVSLAGKADWLDEPGLQALLAALCEDGEEARVAGGAVRNTLLGQAVSDIDIATTTLPDETIARAQAAGFKAVPTGYEHGTITVIANGIPHEVTTLRCDVETHGRHATVRFGRDWKTDAERRDFTINALYAKADGEVVDHVGGLADLQSRTLRFIGDADTRIREDYLRILRFFRFFAWYGHGRPDAEGLKACARLKGGMDRLSAERVWAEMKKLLSAPDPSRALLWMRQTGVLTAILPESEKWGIDGIHGLLAAENHAGLPLDAMLRLEAMLPPDSARMEALADRLRLSGDERKRLREWAFADTPPEDVSDGGLARLLYRGPEQGVRDRIALALASASSPATVSDKQMRAHALRLHQWRQALAFERPVMPVRGKDLGDAGIPAGPAMGRLLTALEDAWVSSGFSLTKDDLVALARRKAAAVQPRD